MSYVNLINKNVDFAFKTVKDLATNVVLTKKVVTGFDFGTGSNTAGADVVLNTTAVIVTSKKGDSEDASNRNTQQKSIMLQRQDVDDVSFYDLITIAGEDWQLGQIIKDDGFVVEVEVFREI